MRTFKQVAAAAAKRSAPMTEISIIYRQSSDAQIAIWDGVMIEKRDERTGELHEGEKWIWPPKSQITVAAVDYLGDLEPVTTYTFRLPEWLAQDRGLI